MYNDVYELMQRRVYSGSFEATAANGILGDITGSGSGGTFGNTSLGSYIADTPPGYIETIIVQAPDIAGATLAKLTMYCYTDNETWGADGTANVKCAIYADNEGVPGDFIAETAVVEVDTTPGWHDFTFASPPAITANAHYWFAWMCEQWIWGKETGSWTALTHLYTMRSYADGFPASLSDGVEDEGRPVNIYGTLTATSDGECPSTVVSAVKWENVTQFRAATDLAKLLSKDYWGEAGNFNIGVRNSCVLALGFDEGAGATASDASGYGNDASLLPAAASFTFGRTSVGDSTRAMSADTKVASKFTANGSGPLSSLTVRCRRTSSTGNIKAALYADSAGSPGALLAETTAVSCGTSAAWRTFVFAEGTEPTVVNGTAYWIAISSAGAYTYTMLSTGTNLEYNNDTYSNGFSDPFGASSYYSDEMCAYATGASFRLSG